MTKLNRFVTVVLLTSLPVFAQTPFFTPGNLVVVVEGCGVNGGTCASVPNGSGANGSYGDNQGAPLTLFQYAPSATASATYVNSLVLPQTASGANFPVSGEYGSSSEGTLSLSGATQYLTLMGYGVNAAAYNANPYGFGTFVTGKVALGQTNSVPSGSYTAVPRVVTLIDANGHINSASAVYNVFDANNPRSMYTASGANAYISGQGSGSDSTGGVFYLPALGVVNSSPTAITGNDASYSPAPPSTIAQDTRTVQIYNNTLYISVDSKEGTGDNRSMIGSLGSAPTSLYTPPTQTSGYTTGPSIVISNSGGTGKVTLTTGSSSNGNNINNTSALNKINMSPVNFFFASPSVVYIADSGFPKNDSNADDNSAATANVGDGGLQKWTNSKSDGSGTWSLAYTLWKGLTQGTATGGQPWNGGVVNNGGTSGTTGLYGLAGVVSGTNVYLYATNSTISDLDPTYLFGITDVLANTSATTAATETFSLLATAPADSNFKGISFAPSIPNGDVEVVTSISGLTFTSAGTGCAPGTYVSPLTLTWTPGSSCTLTVTLPTAPTGVEYSVTWQDSSTGTSDSVTAPATTAIYTATINTSYQITTAAGTGGTVSAGGYEAAGSSFPITATPSAGYSFVNFTDTLGNTYTSNPMSLPVTGVDTVTANFKAEPTDVSSQVTVTTSGLTRNRATGVYSGTVTITNNGSTAITGPIQSVFTNLSSAATLTDATGTVPTGAPYAGAPYITVSGTSSLAAGASVTFPVTFTETGTAAISYTSKTLAGSF